jgi:hypothetical protein
MQLITTQIIFLDIDGVLISNRTEYAARYGYNHPHNFDAMAIGMLNYMSSSYDVEFVISSSWRRLQPYGIVKDYLKEAGFNGIFHNDWATPAKLSDRHRGDEIAEWIQDQNEEGFDYMGYVIIDDACVRASQQDYHVQTDPKEGFLFEHLVQCNKILERNLRKISKR